MSSVSDIGSKQQQVAHAVGSSGTTVAASTAPSRSKAPTVVANDLAAGSTPGSNSKAQLPTSNTAPLVVASSYSHVSAGVATSSPALNTKAICDTSLNEQQNCESPGNLDDAVRGPEVVSAVVEDVSEYTAPSLAHTAVSDRLVLDRTLAPASSVPLPDANSVDSGVVSVPASDATTTQETPDEHVASVESRSEHLEIGTDLATVRTNNDTEVIENHSDRELTYERRLSRIKDVKVVESDDSDLELDTRSDEKPDSKKKKVPTATLR